MTASGHYLLILACSQRKRTTPGLLPAIDRYDGVNFRVLQKAKREGYWPEGLRVLILSAKYGLIEADQPIETYDHRMDVHQANDLRESVSNRLDRVLRERNWHAVFFSLGKNYRAATSKSEKLRGGKVNITHATGGIGVRAAQLKHWILAVHGSTCP